MGKPIYNLFSTRPILPPFIGLIVLFWCVYAIYKLPKYRQLSIFILCLTVSQLAFLSLITMIEGRYAFVFLPLMYSGLAAMLGWFIASNKQIAKCIPILTIVTAAIFCLVSLKDWKLQLLLNFKGAEVSWWQVGMVKADEWMRVQPISTKPPILLSVMNPFMWDFYRFGNYQLLPYMQFQDFAERQVWGVTPLPPDWRSFELNEMKTSRDVYISTVGFNPSHWQDFETFQKQHKLTLVNQDCNNSCRLYRIDN